MPGKKGNCGKGGAPMEPGVGMNGLGKGGIADEEEEGPLLSFSEGPLTVGFLMGLLKSQVFRPLVAGHIWSHMVTAGNLWQHWLPIPVVVKEVRGGGQVGVGVVGVGDLDVARVEELLALLLDEALDLEQLGDLEQSREVILRHVDLALVHVVQDGPDLLVLDVLRRKRLN